MKWGVRNDSSPLSKSKTPKSEKKYDIPEKKSAHRTRLEAKYLSKGFDTTKSEQMAANRIKNEKTAAKFLAVAVVATAAYIGYQEAGKHLVGVAMKKGTPLHYVNAMGPKAEYDRRLYTSFKKSDTAKYNSLLAKSLKFNREGTKVYDTVLKTTEAVKAPSNMQSKKLYKKFLKSNPTLSSPSYNDMNTSIAEGSPIATKFVNHLKTKGFNAIVDINDQVNTGYNSKKPLVIFDGKKTLKKVSDTVLSDVKIDREYTKQINKVIIKDKIKRKGIPLAIAGASISGARGVVTKGRQVEAKQYLKDHPNSKLTEAEVLNMLKEDNRKVHHSVDDALEDILQHHGVLGMKWGVRRHQPYPKGQKSKGKFIGKTKKKLSESRVGQEVRSLKTNLNTLSTKAKLDSMTTSEINKATTRLRLENDLKSYSKGSAEKKQYRNRSRMSDQELNRKVTRMRAKSMYSQNANKATEEIQKAGKRVAESLGSLAYTSYKAGGKVTSADIFEAAVNPRGVFVDDVKERLKGTQFSADDVNKAINKIKNK